MKLVKNDSVNTEKQEQGNTASKYKIIAVIAAVLVVIFSVVIIIADVKKHNEEKAAQEAERIRLEAIERGDPIVLETAEKMVLDSIVEDFENAQYGQASAELLNNFDLISDLFITKCGEKPFYYAGGNSLEALKDKTVDNVLVFASYSTLFYGSFENGIPSGEVDAIRTYYEGQRPRSDFSAGLWTGGKMNGEGTTGFNYLDYSTTAGTEGSDETIYYVGRTGVMKDDTFEGEVTIQAATGSATAYYVGNIVDGKLDENGLLQVDENGDVYQAYNADGENGSEREDSSVWQNLCVWNPDNPWS